MTAIKTVVGFGYEPADLFEARTSVPAKHGHLTFDAGKAVYVLGTPTEPIPKLMMRQIKDDVSDALKVRELLTHKAAVLSGPTTTHDQAGGGPNIAIEISTASAVMFGGKFDIVATHAGTVTHDSKAERMKADTDFLTSLLPKMGHPTVKKMMDSYAAAIRDPAKELGHLFEIVEAAEQLLGGDRTSTYKGLGFTKKEWSLITAPANDPQIKQGRHSGQEIQNMRDVTATEIEQARIIAKRIIEQVAAKTQ